MLPIKIELPDGFLEEEVRCGYTVTTEYKKLWAVELDLLAEFDRVCKKYGLTYFADSGTLLGAIRHHGFIPWDDDIDVRMFREDYEKLEQVAEKEFKYPYFFQTPFSDPGLVIGGSRLRNSATTVVSDKIKKHPYQNKGIFIDIFVYDNAPDSEFALKTVRRILKGYWRIMRYATYYDCYFEAGAKNTLRKRILGKISLMLRKMFGNERIYAGYKRICLHWSGVCTKRIASMESAHGDYVLSRELYGKASYVSFEHMQIPVPNGWDQALRQAYGDYMVMKKSPPLHLPFNFYVDIPYSEFYSRAKGSIERKVLRH